MTFTYGGDPSSGDVDEIRFLIGDTDATMPLLQDEEIEYWADRLADQYSNNLMAAAFCAEAIAARYAGEVTISADGVSYSGSELQDKYLKLAVQLRALYSRLTETGAAPYVGGTLDYELPLPFIRPLLFGIGHLDNVRAGQQNYGNQGELVRPDVADPGDYLW